MIKINLFRVSVVVCAVVALYYTGLLDTISPGRIRRAATGKTYRSILYWGQNRLGINQYSGDAKRQEPSLATMCKLTDHDTVVVSFVMTYFSTNDMPGVDYSTHCKKPFYSASLNDPLYKNRQKLVMLNCPDIGDDIKTCQALGRKVLIGIQPLTSTLSSDSDGIRFAQNIWNMFLGGNGDRPFGAGVVLDGVDLVLHNNVVNGTAAMAKEFRKIIDAASTPYTLMASPRCSFPDAVFGPQFPNTMFLQSPPAFDVVNAHFRYSTDCSYNHADFFYSTLSKWSDWAMTQNRPLTLTLPSSSNGWVGGAPGDYITAEQLISEQVIEKLQAVPALTGVGFWEGSGEFLSHPCKNLGISYGTYFRRLLNGEVITCDYVPDEVPKSKNSTGDDGNTYGGTTNIFVATSSRNLVPYVLAAVAVLLAVAIALV